MSSRIKRFLSSRIFTLTLHLFFFKSSFVFSNLSILATPIQFNKIETLKPLFIAPFALSLIQEFPSTPIISISEIFFELRYEIRSSDEKAFACFLQNILSDVRKSWSANSSVTN